LQKHLAERVRYVPAALETRDQREQRQQLQAARAKQKRGTAVLRRAELDQVADARIAREEERLREKGARLLRRRELAQQDRMKEEWLKAIIAISVATRIGARISHDRGWREHLREREAACFKIHCWMFRASTRRRKRILYQNIVRLRVGVLVACRTLQLTEACMAQPTLLWFLQSHTGHKVKPHLLGSIKDFIFKVKKLQRTWRRIQLQRIARVEALLPHFLAEPLAEQVLARLRGRPAPAAPPAHAEGESPADRSQQQQPSLAGRVDKRRTGSVPSVGHRLEAPHDEARRPRSAAAPSGKLRRIGQEVATASASGNSTGGSAKSSKSRNSNAEIKPVSPKARRNSPGEFNNVPSKHRRRKQPSHGQPALQRGGPASPAGEAREEAPPQSTPPARDCAAQGDAPTFVQAFRGKELLPLVVRREALYRHVREMQQTYHDRITDWSSRMADVDMQLALVKITSNSSLSILEQIKEQHRRPQVVEVHRMKDLYEETYVAFLQGEFKEVIHRHISLMKIFFRGWKRVAHNVKIGQVGNKASGESGGVLRRAQLGDQMRHLDADDAAASASTARPRSSEPAAAHHRFTSLRLPRRATAAATSSRQAAAAHHRASLSTISSTASSSASQDED